MFFGSVLHVHVTVQFGIREESLLTDLAVPGVLVEMASLMGGKLKGLNERVPAHVADEVLFTGMDSSVDSQGVGPLEGLAADVTLIRPGVAVRHQVTLVQVLCPEKLFTHFTLIERLRRALIRATAVLSFRGSLFSRRFFRIRDRTPDLAATFRNFASSASRLVLFPSNRMQYYRFFLVHFLPRWFDPRTYWRSAKKMKKRASSIAILSLFV